VLTSFRPAREAACTPEQLQIAPRLKLAPVTFGALTAAEAGSDPVAEVELEVEPQALNATVTAAAITTARALLLMCTISSP
jgi:hypothetical protein